MCHKSNIALIMIKMDEPFLYKIIYPRLIVRAQVLESEALVLTHGSDHLVAGCLGNLREVT